MAFDAMSPFGISWGYLALLMLPVLLVAIGLLVVVRGREWTPGLWLLLLMAVAAGLWMLLTIGADVTVPIATDPDGAYCVVDPFGHDPDRVVAWDSDCGQALARHLAASSGPTVLALILVVVTTGRGWLRRHPGVH